MWVAGGKLIASKRRNLLEPLAYPRGHLDMIVRKMAFGLSQLMFDGETHVCEWVEGGGCRVLGVLGVTLFPMDNE